MLITQEPLYKSLISEYRRVLALLDDETMKDMRVEILDRLTEISEELDQFYGYAE